MSRFTSTLLVSPLSDGSTWVIMREFGYDVGSEGSNDQINVPVGFQTDFASIPRLLWFVLPKWGKYGNAAVIHDWLYWEQRRTRAQADRIFLQAMAVLSVSALVRHTIYLAVRAFGWLAWYRNRADRLDGFERARQPLPTKATASSVRRGQYAQLVRHALGRTGSPPVSGAAK